MTYRLDFLHIHQIVKEHSTGCPVVLTKSQKQYPNRILLITSSKVIQIYWWSQAGSNRRPPACKAGALPAELWPRVFSVCLSHKFQDKTGKFGGSGKI